MRVAILTREWPPDVYGGAGVHVEHLVPQLRSLVEVEVHCFGGPRADADAHGIPVELGRANPALQTLGVDLEMADALTEANVAHSHTWYANIGGHLASLLHGIPHVITAHSLEPRRPWKAEQLGGGYRISSWVERSAYAEADAIIAVSEGMRRDVLDCYPFIDPARVHVVHNGIDMAAYDVPSDPIDIATLGVDPSRPFALFVGRITRQKGIAPPRCSTPTFKSCSAHQAPTNRELARKPPGPSLHSRMIDAPESCGLTVNLIVPRSPLCIARRVFSSVPRYTNHWAL